MRISGETAFQPQLVKMLIVKGAEFRRQPAQCPHQPKLRADTVIGKPEPYLLRIRNTTLDLALYLDQRIASSEKVRDQIPRAESCKGKVADLVCGLERPTQQIADSLDMSRPGEDLNCKVVVGPGLKTLQSAFFDQIVAELPEAKSGLIVAEAPAGDRAKPFKMGAGTVGVAVLEAQIDRSADDQRMQVEIGKECSRPELGQHVEGRKGRWVTHQGQIDKLLDRAAAELRPDSVVFAPCFLFRGVWRPIDAQMPEIVETDGDGTAALIAC